MVYPDMEDVPLPILDKKNHTKYENVKWEYAPGSIRNPENVKNIHRIKKSRNEVEKPPVVPIEIPPVVPEVPIEKPPIKKSRNEIEKSPVVSNEKLHVVPEVLIEDPPVVPIEKPTVVSIEKPTVATIEKPTVASIENPKLESKEEPENGLWEKVTGIFAKKENEDIIYKEEVEGIVAQEKTEDINIIKETDEPDSTFTRIVNEILNPKSSKDDTNVNPHEDNPQEGVKKRNRKRSSSELEKLKTFAQDTLDNIIISFFSTKETK